jgi:hypothetical protein
MKPKLLRTLAQLALVTTLGLATRRPIAAEISGIVQAANKPIAAATVTLYAAGTSAPAKLAEVNSDQQGAFKLDAGQAPGDAVLYLVAKGGKPGAAASSAANDAVALLAVLGSAPPKTSMVNEFTTLGSVWTCAQFLNGDALSGPKLGLSIAAGNVPNFVNLEKGGYGDTIQDALNSSQTPTMANFATLANLLAAAATQITPDATRRFLAATTPRSGRVPKDTLAALEGVARDSGYKPERLFALLDAFYPVPKGKNLRPVPFMPYLTWAPSAWVLPLKFTGGGLSAPGKLMIDSKGNVWAGDNFIVGAQNQDALWAGNLTKFAPNGKPLSPMTTGFTGGGLQGIGFGMAIDAQDNVWATCYGSRAIVKFDNNGEPLSPANGWTLDGKLGLMQGIVVTPSGDVWALDVEHSQVVHLPEGDPSKARLLLQGHDRDPLKNPVVGPFHLVIDQQDRIWISNAGGDSVTRFPASDPSKIEKFKVGFSPSGMAVDSQGNVWVTSRLGNSLRAKRVWLELVVAMKRGKNPDPRLTRSMEDQKAGERGGNVTILRPDGQQARQVDGGGLVGPWAAAVDGNDHVWISNFDNPKCGIVELAGCRPEANPPGLKMGDQISPPGGYVGGGLQAQIDIDIDPAGNLWISNNWNNFDAVLGRVAEPLSTLGAGQGVVVFYGMAKPVQTPLIGPARPAHGS